MNSIPSPSPLTLYVYSPVLDRLYNIMSSNHFEIVRVLCLAVGCNNFHRHSRNWVYNFDLFPNKTSASQGASHKSGAAHTVEYLQIEHEISWLGIIWRMSDNKLPKSFRCHLFYCTPAILQAFCCYNCINSKFLMYLTDISFCWIYIRKVD